LGALNAFWPQWAAEKVDLIPFIQDYTIILQHWGFMLGVMGVFMIIAAFVRLGATRFSSIAPLRKPSLFTW